MEEKTYCHDRNSFWFLFKNINTYLVGKNIELWTRFQLNCKYGRIRSFLIIFEMLKLEFPNISFSRRWRPFYSYVFHIFMIVVNTNTKYKGLQVLVFAYSLFFPFLFQGQNCWALLIICHSQTFDLTPWLSG